jgi:hypothetical protein
LVSGANFRFSHVIFFSFRITIWLGQIEKIYNDVANVQEVRGLSSRKTSRLLQIKRQIVPGIIQRHFSLHQQRPPFILVLALTM